MNIPNAEVAAELWRGALATNIKPQNPVTVTLATQLSPNLKHKELEGPFVIKARIKWNCQFDNIEPVIIYFITGRPPTIMYFAVLFEL